MGPLFIASGMRGVEQCTPPMRVEVKMHANQQVLERRNVAKQPDVLIRAADAGSSDTVRREAVHALAPKPDLASGNRQILHYAIEEGRLSRAVWADDAMDGPLADIQVEFANCRQSAEPHGQPTGCQDRLG